ncbi:XRE family transcriptional regulator [Sulfolobus sp. A20]|uniref:helix-turn-helix domain-containing protein n=1 Tax=Saccharolobus sp. A20 TaxID=1891280 RepID=UPI0008461714|nr:helix-turn-helix domain-containing protein [Sulfolobus sp. A20]TRM76039.1 helix-turn-helix domain-containing protein [Sulfolobus sp. A20-N-F8]TRM87267.1 helix-turn-helix domain-containing protein [Sulfolobus sp. C3]TRM93400.1 helix-turn-helix domain-containing protein [Sulfolobus sp. A20-N-G8]TRM98233.1 helix-turn-helix domain-containing protein [Sulfolobus sp. E1]AOL16010.1 XRE family transcriptional regulator [Sulfolobus sp. A20]
MSKQEDVFSYYVIDTIGKRIAGDIVWSKDSATSLRKWRELFGISQGEIAREMGIKPSVIADYERSRRQAGSEFIRRYVSALISIDSKRGYKVIKDLSKMFGINYPFIVDMGDFSYPKSIDEIIRAVDGVLINSYVTDKKVYGYLVTDSIKAIISLSGMEFYQALSLMVNKVVVFTKVSSGRSPMIALKVAPIKPPIVVFHRPVNLDPLALELSESENMTVIVSTKAHEEDLVKGLKSLLVET